MQTSIRRAGFERTRVLPTPNNQAYDLVGRALAKLRPNTTRLDNDDAMAHWRRCARLNAPDPLDPVKVMFTMGEGSGHMWAGRYNLALDAADRSTLRTLGASVLAPGRAAKQPQVSRAG